jgi:hypothetical protein
MSVEVGKTYRIKYGTREFEGRVIDASDGFVSIEISKGGDLFGGDVNNPVKEIRIPEKDGKFSEVRP